MKVPRVLFHFLPQCTGVERTQAINKMRAFHNRDKRKLVLFRFKLIFFLAAIFVSS